MNTAYLADLNWLRILAGAAGYFILGSIWYAPLFGKKWVAYQRSGGHHDRIVYPYVFYYDGPCNFGEQARPDRSCVRHKMGCVYRAVIFGYGHQHYLSLYQKTSGLAPD